MKMGVRGNVGVGGVGVWVVGDRSDDGGGLVVERVEMSVGGNGKGVECVLGEGDGGERGWVGGVFCFGGMGGGGEGGGDWWV